MVKDFFRDVHGRITNPLFSSFIISWIIINWRIPIGLIFYNNEALKLDGYHSYIDLILKNYTQWNYFFYPLVLSLSYTFIFPFLKNGILAFQAWIQTWGNDLNLKITKQGKVSMDRYIRLKEDYSKQSKSLEEFIDKETDFVKENSDLKVEKAQLNLKIEEFTVNLNKWQTHNQIELLNGNWDYRFTNSIDNNEKIYRVHIMNGKAYFYSDAAMRNKIEIYAIHSFICNPIQQILNFTLWPESHKTPVLHQLNFPNGITELYGKENNQFDISYKKIAG